MENYLLGLEGSYVLGYQLDLPEKYSLGQSDYDSLNEYWSKALRDLPTNTIFLKQDVFREELFNTDLFPDENFIQRANKEYFNKTEFLHHYSFMFFIIPNKSIKNTSLNNPFRPPVKKEFVEFDHKIKDFNVAVQQCVNYLNGISLSGSGKIQIKPLSNDFMNSYYEVYMSGYDFDLSKEIKKEWEHLRVGEEYCSIIRFSDESSFPQTMKTCRKDNDFSNDVTEFFKNYGDNFGHDLKFNHVYNQIAMIDDPKRHIDQARKNNIELHKTAKIDKANEIFAKETSEMLEEIVKNSDNERLIRGHNNVIIFAPDSTTLNSRINNVIDKFKDIDLKPLRLFGDNLLAVYEYSFPLNAHKFIENHLYVSSLQMFSAFLIYTGAYKDDEEGVLYNSRLGNVPVKVDLWDAKKKYIKARNGFVIAPTGYGKSFNANHIITHFYGSGAKQVIVDLGGSYQKLAKLFPDDIYYISYQEGDNLGINPFVLTKTDLDTDKIEDLVEFIGVHFARDRFLTEQEKATLRIFVEQYYKNVSEAHSLPDFIQFFIDNNKKLYEEFQINSNFLKADEFILMMNEFIGTGLYSSLYRDTNDQLIKSLYDKKIIVFELDKIRSNKLLLSVMLQLISTTIQNVIWNDKSTRGIIWFDEVAEQLHWDGMLRRLQWFYQAIRKQNGAINIILQSISQLPQNELANSIIENTQILYIIYAKNYRAIQERFQLSEHCYYQMSSISSDFSGDRPFSEMLILRANKHQVYRLEVPKKVYWAYQTEGEQNQRLLKYADEYQNMEKAIDKMIELQNNNQL